jgi:predicted AlkP superfamily pyrophosphatase or phosphodiesterase
MEACVFATTHAEAQLQAFEAIQAPDPLHVHLPSISAQQHVYTPIAEPRPPLGEIAQAKSQQLLARSAASIGAKGS